MGTSFCFADGPYTILNNNYNFLFHVPSAKYLPKMFTPVLIIAGVEFLLILRAMSRRGRESLDLLTYRIYI
jgi:hypothetical protein